MRLLETLRVGCAFGVLVLAGACQQNTGTPIPQDAAKPGECVNYDLVIKDLAEVSANAKAAIQKEEIASADGKVGIAYREYVKVNEETFAMQHLYTVICNIYNGKVPDDAKRAFLEKYGVNFEDSGEGTVKQTDIKLNNVTITQNYQLFEQAKSLLQESSEPTWTDGFWRLVNLAYVDPSLRSNILSQVSQRWVTEVYTKLLGIEEDRKANEFLDTYPYNKRNLCLVEEDKVAVYEKGIGDAQRMRELFDQQLLQYCPQ